MPIRSLLKSILFAVFCAVLAYAGFRIAQKQLHQPADTTAESAPRASEVLTEMAQQNLEAGADNADDTDNALRFELNHAFATLDGKSQTIKDDSAKVYLLNFWATWCAPCVEEIPLLEAAHQKYQADGLKVVGLSTDINTEDVIRFQDKIVFSYPSLMTDTSFVSQLEQLNPIGAIPFTIFLDADGVIVDTKLGVFEEAGLNDTIERLLAE